MVSGSELETILRNAEVDIDVMQESDRKTYLFALDSLERSFASFTGESDEYLRSFRQSLIEIKEDYGIEYSFKFEE